MNDTSPDVLEALDALLARRSGSDRVRMTCEMFDLARRLAIADITTTDPTIDTGRLRELLLARLYGEDFSDDELRDIVMRWRRTGTGL